MTTLTEPGTVTTRRSSRLMWAILGLVLLADALDVIDATVTNIAAPTIARELNGGESLIKWLGPAYMLAMGVLLVVGGRLGDKFGQRRLFLIGMGGFTLASAVAGFSPDPALLIVARVAQGAFGALLIPQGMAIMTKAFDRDMLAKAFGLFGPVLGLSSVGGPVLAGFIISADLFGLSWRPIFLVNIILGVIGLVMAVKILPRDDDGDRSTVVDGWGSGLLAVAMIGLLYGLIEGSTNGWSAVPVVSIAVGVLFFAAFAYRQRTATHPLIKPSLLKNRGFTSGMLVGLVVFAAGTGLIFVLSLFLQEGLHASPRDASLGLVPLTLGLIAAGFAAMGGLVAKLGRTARLHRPHRRPRRLRLGPGPRRSLRDERQPLGAGPGVLRHRRRHRPLLRHDPHRCSRRRETRRSRQRQRLAQLDPATRFSDRLGRGHVDLLPGRNLRTGPRDESQLLSSFWPSPPSASRSSP